MASADKSCGEVDEHAPKVSRSAVVIDLERALGESLKRGGMILKEENRCKMKDKVKGKPVIL